MNEHLRTARRLWLIVKPFWTSEMKWRGAAMLAAITALNFLTAYVTVKAGQLTGNAITAMQLQQEHAWLVVLVSYAALGVVLTPANCIADFLRTRLALMWYQWKSRFLFHRAYHLGILNIIGHDPRTDNPGQILTQEIESFINTFIGLALPFVDAVIKVTFFLTQLFFIAYTLTAAGLIWSTVGVLVVFFVGRSLPRLAAELSSTDASLREELQEAADGENWHETTDFASEEALADERLRAKMQVLVRQMWVNFYISLVNVPFNHLSPIVPIVVIGPFYFHSLMEIGTVTTAVYAFGKAIDSATMFAKQYGGVSSLGGNIRRLGTFFEILEEYTQVAAAHPQAPRLAMQRHLLVCRLKQRAQDLTELQNHLAPPAVSSRAGKTDRENGQ